MSHEKDVLVSVVIVNYNGAEFLEPCLQSVYSQAYRPIEVIVVDNASSDESVRIMREKFPDARLILCERNIGFAGGNNRGVMEATGDYVVLLNNDTIVEPQWLTALLEYATKPEVGVATSRVITEGVPDKFYEMNGTISYLGYNIMREFADVSQVFFGSAASLIFKKANVDRPFLDEFFLYHEDVFLSWKLRLMGLDVRMAQHSVVRHKGSATTRRQPSRMVTFYQERNRLLNVLFFFERRTLVLLIPYLILDAVAKTILSLLTQRKSLLGILRAYWWIGANLRWVLHQREMLQSKRRVPDSEIMKLMSCKVVDGDNLLSRWINGLSKLYATSVGLAHHG
ncbi:MAG: hypothetical protein HW412_1765 [Bacteroidetes bacterium]|nr:hypothetical protein [Bacteroidota bacterium]